VKHALSAGLAAALLGCLVFAFQPFQNSPPGSSAKRTIYSFAFALGHHNYGRACSYMADKIRGADPNCPIGLQSSAAMALMFGADVYAHMRVVPGSEKVNKDGSVTYKIRSDEIPPVAIRVAKQKSSGKWRVTRIG